jgi:hypothetical protein
VKLPCGSEVLYQPQGKLNFSLRTAQYFTMAQAITSHLRKQILHGISIPSFDFPAPAW